jgi:hypothetical protein
MRLRRAVPKMLARSSVPSGLPLNKNRALLTRSESTLPQTLIPLDFISFNSNVYRKPGEGHSVSAQKFVNSSLAVCRSCAHARIPATRIPSMLYFITRGHPGGWGISLVGQPTSSPSRASRAMNLGCPFSQCPEYPPVPNHQPRNTGHRVRVTEHGPRPHGPPVPLRCNAQSARIAGVSACSPPGNLSAHSGV